MRYEVSIGGELHQVEVKEVSTHVFDVSVDQGEAVRVDAIKSPRTVYSVLVEGRQFEGSVDEREDGTLDVRVGTGAFEIGVVDERKKLLLGGGAHAATGKQELRAQMPGKVVKLLVRVGDRVERDQGLIVIEAMKMENELKSPVDGEVEAVEVAEGDTVATDALLVVVAPPEAEDA